MNLFFLQKFVWVGIISVSCLISSLANAGGITLGATRIIYPADKKQVNISVTNTDAQANFLVQSWVEQSNGKKSQDFVVTPPVYVSGPGNENILRVMYVGMPLAKDKESLFYFNTKAIPSINKKDIEGRNILMLAATTRIKLFVRPAGLQPAIEKAPLSLTFQRVGTQLRINNPTPYHITLVKMKVGEQTLPDSMVPPQASISLPLNVGRGNTITYRTLNDYGAATPEARTDIK